MARTLSLKYAGTCATCGADLDAGTLATWHMRGIVTCTTCEYTITPEAWQERIDAKAERYATYAANAAARSNAAYENSSRLANQIPFGQPILVGHHSEGKHRNHIKKIDRNMRTSVDEAKKADYWEHRAKVAANPRGISSYDPEAADKLRAKIEKLEAQRDQIKALNAAFKKAGLKQGEPVTPELCDAVHQIMPMSDRTRENMLSMRRWPSDGPVFPSYVLTNLGSEIRRYQKRLAALTK